MAYQMQGNITKNFTLDEMCNKDAKESVKLILTPESVEHAQMMQELRDWAERALNVSSWHRTPTYNKSCGGASNSAHLDARATDINNIKESEYHDFTIAWQTICKAHSKIGGVCYYKWGMHFDSHSDKFGCTTFRVQDYR